MNDYLEGFLMTTCMIGGIAIGLAFGGLLILIIVKIFGL